MHARTESHFFSRIGWLRAAVLGANDGIVSTASLIVGVAAASAPVADVLMAGSAGLVAGAMSMAAGEYVSVSSQHDTELADLAREREELAAQPEAEREELARLYLERGVEPALANQLSQQLMVSDALGAHARDELGILEGVRARPLQAAVTSAATFAIGAALPLSVVLVVPRPVLPIAVFGASVGFLGLLGAVGARLGGADIARATFRVLIWGALAMAVTAASGAIFGAVI